MRPFRLLVAVLVALAVSTPAAAQFGKIKDALNKKTEPKPTASSRGGPGRRRHGRVDARGGGPLAGRWQGCQGRA